MIGYDLGGGKDVWEAVFLCYIINVSLLAMWFSQIIIIPAMEVYSGQDWVTSYKIGFLGQYCDEKDYFTADKWNEYDWDIRLLVISWFLF